MLAKQKKCEFVEGQGQKGRQMTFTHTCPFQRISLPPLVSLQIVYKYPVTPTNAFLGLAPPFLHYTYLPGLFHSIN